MYLLTAVADLVRIGETSNNEAKRNALERLWSNMVDKKMSLTGGIGAQKHYEGFGIDYFLPSGTDEGGCYNETCAGIGVMMLAERMLQVGELPHLAAQLLIRPDRFGRKVRRYHGTLLLQCGSDWHVRE